MYLFERLQSKLFAPQDHVVQDELLHVWVVAQYAQRAGNVVLLGPALDDLHVRDHDCHYAALESMKSSIRIRFGSAGNKLNVYDFLRDTSVVNSIHYLIELYALWTNSVTSNFIITLIV